MLFYKIFSLDDYATYIFFKLIIIRINYIISFLNSWIEGYISKVSKLDIVITTYNYYYIILRIALENKYLKERCW